VIEMERKFICSELAAEILNLLYEKGEKSRFTIEERTKNLIRKIIIETTLNELELEELIKESEGLAGKTYKITEKGKKIVEEERAKVKETKHSLTEV